LYLGAECSSTNHTPAAAARYTDHAYAQADQKEKERGGTDIRLFSLITSNLLSAW